MAQYHQPYDPYYQSLPPPYAVAEGSGIKTLFVSGLPDDVKAREIHNLFRRRPGFESCQLKYTGRGNQVVAFATFFNHQSAMAALHSLNGVKFDPETGSTLHIELARSNSRRKFKPGRGPYVVIDRRTKKEASVQETSSNEGESDPEQDPSEESSDSGDHEGDLMNEESEAADASDSAPVTVNEQSEKFTADGVQPCSTLFIANLGPNCTEEELKEVLSQYPGFNLIKVHARGAMPVAFVDFEETKQASKAMEELQGSLLPSSDRGGMLIEYARSKMRKH